MESFGRDVLPTGVRRRRSMRDGMLPVVLLGELLAGVALGAAWPRLTMPTAVASQRLPSTAVVVPAVVAPPAVAPGTTSAVTSRMQSPAVAPVPVHTPATVPTARNPFAVLTTAEAP